jgi:hypothetical protein
MSEQPKYKLWLATDSCVAPDRPGDLRAIPADKTFDGKYYWQPIELSQIMPHAPSEQPTEPSKAFCSHCRGRQMVSEGTNTEHGKEDPEPCPHCNGTGLEPSKPLSVEEARAKGVCRYCREGPDTDCHGIRFVTERFGKPEHCHIRCFPSPAKKEIGGIDPGVGRDFSETVVVPNPAIEPSKPITCPKCRSTEVSWLRDSPKDFKCESCGYFWSVEPSKPARERNALDDVYYGKPLSEDEALAKFSGAMDALTGREQSSQPAPATTAESEPKLWYTLNELETFVAKWLTEHLNKAFNKGQQLAGEQILRERDEARQEIERLKAKYDRLDRDDDQVMRERDGYHDMLDKFVGVLGGDEIHGEHSNLNDPWQNALDFADELNSKLQSEQARTAELSKIVGEFRVHHLKFSNRDDISSGRGPNTFIVRKERVEEFDIAMAALLAKESAVAASPGCGGDDLESGETEKSIRAEESAAAGKERGG